MTQHTEAGPSPHRPPTNFNLACRVNGRPYRITLEFRETLLHVLRSRLGLTGTKRACDLQICGACTVLVDGRPVSACTYLAYEAQGRDVLTIEGLAGTELHPLQQAFIDQAALQCGYCTPGMIMTAKALLDESPMPTEDEIKHYMHGNICRCTGYKSILEAVQDAARRLVALGRPDAAPKQTAGT